MNLGFWISYFKKSWFAIIWHKFLNTLKRNATFCFFSTKQWMISTIHLHHVVYLPSEKIMLHFYEEIKICSFFKRQLLVTCILMTYINASKHFELQPPPQVRGLWTNIWNIYTVSSNNYHASHVNKFYPSQANQKQQLTGLTFNYLKWLHGNRGLCVPCNSLCSKRAAFNLCN